MFLYRGIPHTLDEEGVKSPARKLKFLAKAFTRESFWFFCRHKRTKNTRLGGKGQILDKPACQ
ncbi:MAG: hypothetical protein A3F33_00185 [Candidatus Woykebacteria bacterium RIFCSPHIGHO2_12_FULL_43_10]|nr:MAG: hypothetical protein A3F33_00185 [Candidatus Woykebacteria bacterium RIFCSPHIGHO2_12_FULL_43_10]OGY30207.1 MAG: hypothetical protein A3J50_02015 [Candidatus Woykebacteria bacterium RIFCSPHIGHO2_02_FULL_43_16b]